MSRKRILLPLILFAFAISCLKAKRSPFDFSSKSPTSNLIIGRVLTSTNTASSSTAPPSNLTYSITALQSKLIPGNTTVITPTFSGTVSSWTISPTTLPPGVTFDTKTGVITCSPPIGSPAFPLTNFIVTAINPGGNTSFTVPLQVLGSGENVWTVINGVAGGNTNAGVNSMKYDATCDCIYIAGTTLSNLDGQVIPSTGGNASGYVSKYDLNGNRIWTRVFGVSGSSSTTVAGLVTDASGNIYIGGNKGAGNFKGCTGVASYTGYIVKYDLNGNFQWTTCSGASQRHYYTGIFIDNSGNVLGGGTTYDYPIDGMSSSSTTDQSAVIQKFNSTTGARISGVIVPGDAARGTDAYGSAIDSSGKIYLGVATRSSSYCGDGTVNWRPALFRYDANMNYLGCSFIPTGSYSSFAFGVTTTPSGDSFLSGYANTSATFDGIPAIGTTDGYVTKFNSAGTKIWTQRIGVSGAVTAINSVVYEPTSDKLFFTGLTGGNLQGNVITGTRDMFVAKYNNDATGTQVWLKMQGIKNDTLAVGVGDGTSITFDSYKTMYSFGDTNGSISGITNPASPNRSLFLVRNVQ